MLSLVHFWQDVIKDTHIFFFFFVEEYRRPGLPETGQLPAATGQPLLANRQRLVVSGQISLVGQRSGPVLRRPKSDARSFSFFSCSGNS